MEPELHLLLAHDPDTIFKWVTEESPYLKTALRRFMGRSFSEEDRDEIVQDAFLRALRGLPMFRAECKIRTWLVSIAGNLAKNRVQRNLIRGSHDKISINTPIYEEITIEDTLRDETDFVDEIETAEHGAEIEAAIQRLDSRSREIILLRTVLHQEYAEIAAALSVNIGTVKSRLARVRQKIRALITDPHLTFVVKPRPCRRVNGPRRWCRTRLARHPKPQATFHLHAA